MKATNFKNSVRNVAMLIACLAATALFASCDKDNNGNNGNETTDDFVVINGMKWATRNIDEFGKFTAKPEDVGHYYQWNNGKPLATITETKWEKTNDPSPAGYRIPTATEIYKLMNNSKVTNEWTELNGVWGRKFTDIETGKSIFLPAGGYCGSSGTLIGGTLGEEGRYWGSMLYVYDGEVYENHAYYLHFSEYDDATNRGYTDRSMWFPIRCIKE